MERVVTINLNGNSYQLEEPAYDALRAYIGRAEATLADNPDKGEIVRDLEQAIADKCARFLSPAKSVVTADEMTTVLTEMGPVEGEGDAKTQRAESPGVEGARKRLFRIRDGAMIAGICSGLSAYLDIDVNIIRILAVVLGFVTGGWLFLVYLIAMFIIPSAHTSEEWAQAHGVPFNAQEVIDRAKREYARVSEDISRDWRGSWRAQRRAWRDQSRSWRAGPFFADVQGPGRSGEFGAQPQAPARPVGYATRIFAGLAAFILSVAGAALLIGFLVALFALLNTGAVLNWTPPADVPLWLAIVILCIAYGAISTPLRYLRRASYAAASGYSYHGRPSGDFIAFLAMIAGAVLGYQFIPEFRVWVEALPETLRAIGQSLRAL
jgi:phage shock protein PspC (stress-responsive transcriptional regulator)